MNQNEKEDENESIIKQEDYFNNSITSWDEMELNYNILRGIYANGFEKPSPIQSKGIRPIIQKKDIIAQAQSGTGKTGCFCIGCLSLIDFSKKTTQALILAPTRELAMQIQGVLTILSNFINNIKIQLLIGGTSINTCIENLVNEVPHIVVGCPGRVYDMFRRKHLLSENLKCIILDEADEMLSAGFKEQIYNIFQFMPSNVQVGLFSATLSSEVLQITEKFMRDPVKILVKQEALTLEGINQYYIGVEEDNSKYECIKDLFASFSISQSIIYCNSTSRVQELYDSMINDNFPVGLIHSNMEKQERTKNFNDFKSGKNRVLISSNVTARGIDIQQVSTIINFDIPKDVATYLHRIGRSGRWGRKGIGINFVTKRDIRAMKEIEQFYQTEIKEMPVNWAETLENN
tara:strand:+ start:10517 stop:11728 length:1212 start_codon:yes stop_codon:yes gene_type:complete